MEVKSGEGTVVVADRNRYSDECCNNRVMDRLCQMEHQQSNGCCEIKSLVRESENRLALQAERNHCEVMKGQQEIKCLIENTAKDQEIARLNRVVDAQRDQNIINSVVQALGNKTA